MTTKFSGTYNNGPLEPLGLLLQMKFHSCKQPAAVHTAYGWNLREK